MVRTLLLATVTAAVAFGAAGILDYCLDDNSATHTVASMPSMQPRPVADQSTSTAVLGSPGRPIQILETEYKVTVATRTLKPGKHTFAVKNTGTIVHAINFDGPHVEDATTGKLAPGKSGTITLTLAAGTYRVYCPIPHHKAMGMQTTITVG